jgi:DNA-binding transcriptional LysR family regulator
MLDAVKLATLREVIACGSFSAAGVTLGLTQPAVSRQVSLLERQVGIQLVRRTRQGVFATEAGRRLSEHADAILARIATAEADLRGLAGVTTGRVRIGMFFTAFAVLAPEVQADVERRHPRLEVSYELVDRAAAFELLRAAELELAVVFDRSAAPTAPPPDIELTTLFDDPARVLLPVRHRLAPRASLTTGELAGEQWLEAREGSEEPVELQVHVAAGAGIVGAYALNVILNPPALAVRPLADAPPRRVQLARASGLSDPAADALADLLRRRGQLRSSAAL